MVVVVVMMMMVVVVVVVAVMRFCRRIFFWHTFRRWVLRPRSDRRKGDSRGQKYRHENFLYHFLLLQGSSNDTIGPANAKIAGIPR
jgi:hypothetical protein